MTKPDPAYVEELIERLKNYEAWLLRMEQEGRLQWGDYKANAITDAIRTLKQFNRMGS